MINELTEMVEDLKRYGIDNSSQWHSNLPKCPNGTAYKVILDDDGKVKVVEPFDKETCSGLRYYYPNNSASFPCIKIANWLSQEQFETFKEDLAHASSQISKISGKKFKKFKKSIKCGEELVSKLNMGNPVYRCLINLFESISKTKIENLYSSIFEEVMKIADENSMVNACYLYLDIDPKVFDSDYIPVQHPKLFEAINADLLITEKNARKDDEQGIDSLGKNIAGYDSTFALNITKVGKVILFTKNRDDLTNYRYGVIGRESFPIGGESRDEIQKSLQYLTEAAKYNKTYKNLGNHKGKTVLAITYCDGLTACNLISPLFYTEEENVKENLNTDFEKESEGILKAFNQVLDTIPDARFKIFCFKTDKGGAYTSYNRKMLLKNVILCIELWNEGCKNFMPPSSYMKFKTKIPAPLDFWKNINKKIQMGPDGKYKDSSFEFFSINDIYDLFLGDDRSLSQITRIMANHHLKMLLQYKNGKMLSYALPYILPMLGIVLQRNNQRKDKYMKEIPYNLGQLCAVADRLQEMKYESTGQRPPTNLIGAEHIQWMRMNPIQGLSSLTSRLTPYMEWAQRNIKNVPYAGYSVAKIKEIFEKIKEEDLSNLKLTDVDKILIGKGYFVGIQKLEKKGEIIESK